MQTMSDEQLVGLAQQGDRDALGELLGRYRQQVFAVTFRILSRRDEALDATQETLLRAFRYIGGFQSSRSFGPWIRRVAVRAALDQAKRGGKERPSNQEPDQLADSSGDPYRQAVRTELADAIRLAFALLSPSQRAAFSCKEIDGMDTRRTARAMGCSQATVRWHLYQAKKRLAQALAGCERGGP
ncbi:MAG: sigma-70 family RNA polymerase sigma factor [Deltaproteobacteria bacterium]|nr:sigma-70 family RNA polymerase sigma factor [Deltaproteobacteria bacterium]